MQQCQIRPLHGRASLALHSSQIYLAKAESFNVFFRLPSFLQTGSFKHGWELSLLLGTLVFRFYYAFHWSKRNRKCIKLIRLHGDNRCLKKKAFVVKRLSKQYPPSIAQISPRRLAPPPLFILTVILWGRLRETGPRSSSKPHSRDLNLTLTVPV